jgi:hypothetical protein
MAGYPQDHLLAVPRTPETPHPTPPSHRAKVVARLLTGDPLYDVDLDGVQDAGEARGIIAAALGMHPANIELVDIGTHTVLEDKTPLVGDVQVVRLNNDTVVEHDAEAAFLAAAKVKRMADLKGREALVRTKQCGLLALPENLHQLDLLQCLDLRCNELMHLPETFGCLVSLKILDLTKNKLRALPTSIGQLKELKFLHLHANQLMGLPESFGQLASLQNVHLSRNQLTQLPESFGQLSALRKLYLKGNKLKRLPDPLHQLLMLEVLDL